MALPTFNLLTAASRQDSVKNGQGDLTFKNFNFNFNFEHLEGCKIQVQQRTVVGKRLKIYPHTVISESVIADTIAAATITAVAAASGASPGRMVLTCVTRRLTTATSTARAAATSQWHRPTSTRVSGAAASSAIHRHPRCRVHWQLRRHSNSNSNSSTNARMASAAADGAASAATAATAALELVLPRPDDWHLHLRDGDALASLMRGARHCVLPRRRPSIWFASALCCNLINVWRQVELGRPPTPDDVHRARLHARMLPFRSPLQTCRL